MDNLPLSLLDIAVLLIVIVSGGFSLMRGFIHEVLSIGAWVGAGFATLYGFHPLLPFVVELIAIPLLAEIVTGAALFIIVLGLLTLFIRFCCKNVRNSIFAPLDSTLGFLFGLLRGAVLSCVAWIFLFVFLIPEDSGWPSDVQRSKTRPFLVQGSAFLITLVPGEFRSSTMNDVLDNAQRARQAFDSKQAYERFISPLPTATPEQSRLDEGTGQTRQSRENLRNTIETTIETTQ